MMKLIINNNYTEVIFGGKDFNIDYNFISLLSDFLSVYSEKYYFSTKYNTKIYNCNYCNVKVVIKPKQTPVCKKCGYSNLTFIKRMWDGKLRFFKNYKFKTGLLPLVIDFIDSKGFDLELIDNRNNSFKLLPIVDKIGKYTLNGIYSYQLRAVNTILNNRIKNLPFIRGIVDVATNGGKTTIMGSILLSTKVKTLLIVHRVELFKQMIEFFTPIVDTGIINGKKVQTDKMLTIAMVNVLKNRSNSIEISKFLNSIRMVIVDESHRAVAPTYRYILDKINAYSILYFSGTPLDVNDEGIMNILGYSGNTLVKITNDYLINLGVSQRPVVNFVKYKPEKIIANDYHSILTQILYDKNKFNIFKRLILENINETILIVVNYIEHGKWLYESLIDLPVNIQYIHGSSKNREFILNSFKSGNINILITSMILKEAVNLPNITMIFNYFGGKSTITVKQIVGRGLRLFDDNDIIKIYDWYDDYLLEHTESRIAIYSRENFEINYI